MSKEMDLLKRILATGWLDHELSCEVQELLAQPEQELSVKLPESEDEAVMMNLLSDNWLRNHAPHRLNQPEQESEHILAETKIEWYGKGFRQGVNEFAPPKPLTEDVIYALDKEGVVENMDDHQVRYVIRWIRRVEKAHGIGGGE